MVKAAAASDFAHVPAGSGEPEHMRVETVGEAPKYAPSLRKAYRGPTTQRPPADMIETLREMPDDPAQE